MDLDLTGRNAFVTGANGGLGSHFAQTLAKAGANVAIAARRVESLRPVQDAIERARRSSRGRSRSTSPIRRASQPRSARRPKRSDRSPS